MKVVCEKDFEGGRRYPWILMSIIIKTLPRKPQCLLRYLGIYMKKEQLTFRIYLSMYIHIILGRHLPAQAAKIGACYTYISTDLP